MLRVAALATILLATACNPKACAPPAPEPSGASAPSKGAADRVTALVRGTALESATEEERRLSLKIAALEKVRSEMQGILEALPAEREAAKALKEKVSVLEKELAPADVKRVLREAAEEAKRRERDDGALLERARAIDQQLDPLLSPEALLSDDTATVRQLKLELKKQQEATMGLAAATRVAFRALVVIEQMKIALPKLEALASEKGRGG